MSVTEVLGSLFAAHDRSLRTRIRLLVRCLSQLLVASPRRFCVVGSFPDEIHAALLRRIEWFHSGAEGARFAVRRADGWFVHEIANGIPGPTSPAGPLRAFWYALVGKVLVHDYTPRWLKLDALLPYKVFVINWTREFRTSSWRFAASVADRPLQQFAAGCSRQDSRPRTPEVVIVGNGPSAYRVFEPQFDGMDVIVCNTAIKSKRLLAERNVVALGFIDATFFVGPSAYSEAFYSALDEAVRERDFSVYVDHEHQACVLRRTPALHPNRVFPVFLDGAIPPRPDFRGGRIQCTSHSVFTSILLPVAATYYRTIHLVGFDGKDPAMKNYFWKHSAEFQFNELLPTVRESDPGFFSKRDYEDYSRRNAEEVDRFITRIEQSGAKVIMTHPSFIEPLHRRYDASRSGGMNPHRQPSAIE